MNRSNYLALNHMTWVWAIILIEKTFLPISLNSRFPKDIFYIKTALQVALTKTRRITVKESVHRRR